MFLLMFRLQNEKFIFKTSNSFQTKFGLLVVAFASKILGC